MVPAIRPRKGGCTRNAGPGDDQVTLTNTTTGPFKFIGSSGSDTFELQSSHLGVTKVTGASGVLTMPATSTYFQELTLKSGPEIDVLNWLDVTVDSRLKLTVGGGNDLVTFTDGTVGAQTTIKLSGGSDHFTDDGGLYGEFVSVIAGAGDDEIVFEDSTLSNALDARLGGGLNQMSLLAEDGSTVVGNSATIKGGGLLDAIELRVVLGTGIVQIGNDLVVALKSGTNDFEMKGDVGIGNDLFYTGGGLDDVVDWDEASVGNDANLILSNGFNDVIIDDTLIGNDLRITAGNGDDSVQLTGTTFVGGNQLISLGGGNNTGP